MKSLLMTCCESVSIDSLSNRMSLFHLTDGLTVASFPVVLPPMWVVAWIERSLDQPGQSKVEFRIKLGGKQAAELSTEVNFQGKYRTRLVNELAGIVMGEPGLIEIDLFHGGKVLDQWSMPINSIAAPHILPAALKSENTSVKPPAKKVLRLKSANKPTRRKTI